MADPTREPASVRTLRIIWLAFLLAPAAYIVIGWAFTQGAAPRPYPPSMLVLLMLFTAGAIAIGVFMPERLLKAALRPPVDDRAILAAYQTSLIIRWAAFEYIGVCGLLMTMMSRQALPAVAGAALAIVLNVFSRPDPEAALQRWRQG